MISIACAISVLRFDRKCIYIFSYFLEINSAWHELGCNRKKGIFVGGANHGWPCLVFPWGCMKSIGKIFLIWMMNSQYAQRWNIFSVTNSNMAVLWRSPWLCSWLAVLWRSPWLCCVMPLCWLYCEGHPGCAVWCLMASCTVKAILGVLCDAPRLCEGHHGCAVWCLMAVLWRPLWLWCLMPHGWLYCEGNHGCAVWCLMAGCTVKAILGVLCDAPWLYEGHHGCAMWCPMAMWRPSWLCCVMPHGCVKATLAVMPHGYTVKAIVAVPYDAPWLCFWSPPWLCYAPLWLCWDVSELFYVWPPWLRK